MSVADDGSAARVHIDIDQAEAIAAFPDVVFVQPRQDAVIGR